MSYGPRSFPNNPATRKLARRFRKVWRRLMPVVMAGFATIILLSECSAQLLDSQATPATAREDKVVDTYHGVPVPDPYRWMENQPAELASWAKSQNDYTEAAINKLPGYRQLAERTQWLASQYSFISDLKIRNGRLFYVKVANGAAQPVLCERNSSTAAERILADPVRFGTASKRASLASYWPSNDGQHVMFGIDTGGAENTTLHVLDVQSGDETEPPIPAGRWARPAWLPDNRSFLFTRISEPQGGPKGPGGAGSQSTVYRHTIGGGANAEEALFGDRMETSSHMHAKFAYTAPGQSYVLAYDYHGDPDYNYYAAPASELQGTAAPWHTIAQARDRIRRIDLHGDEIYALVPDTGSGLKLVKTKFAHPDYGNAEVLLTDTPAKQIVSFVAAPDALYVECSSKGRAGLVRVPYERSSKPVALSLPYEGYLHHDYFNSGSNSSGGLEPVATGGVLFQLTGWTHPAQYFRYDPTVQTTAPLMSLPPYPIDLSQFVSEEVDVPSNDGVLVPLTIVHRKNLKKDGRHPTVLAGYGAYGVVLDPSFGNLLPWNPIPMAWLERGAVYAYAHVRGGGELGEAWHQAATKTHKSNSISDFIACAEFLIHHRYTSSERLAIEGGSAGGILVGGALTKRPDLFRAAGSYVGVHDLLRFELTPVGPGQTPEFGTVKDKEEFAAMYSISPYHQVKAGVEYPAAFFYAGANDVRTPLWEVTKMVARLQANTASGRPVLLYIDYDAGHSTGMGIDQFAKGYARVYAFFLSQMGDPAFVPN